MLYYGFDKTIWTINNRHITQTLHMYHKQIQEVISKIFIFLFFWIYIFVGYEYEKENGWACRESIIWVYGGVGMWWSAKGFPFHTLIIAWSAQSVEPPKKRKKRKSTECIALLSWFVFGFWEWLLPQTIIKNNHLWSLLSGILFPLLLHHFSPFSN